MTHIHSLLDFLKAYPSGAGQAAAGFTVFWIVLCTVLWLVG